MKLSEILKDNGIAFSFPIEIKDESGNNTYYEEDRFWWKTEYDAAGNNTYYEVSDGFWCKYEYDENGNETYSEDSDGLKSGTRQREH